MGVIGTLLGDVEARFLVVVRVPGEALEDALPARHTLARHRGQAVLVLSYTRVALARSRWFGRSVRRANEQLSWRVPVRDGEGRPGVWIPRRHTSSWLGARRAGLARARFRSAVEDERLRLVVSAEGVELVRLDARNAGELRGSMFATVRQAREFLDDGGAVTPAHPLLPGLDRLAGGSDAFDLDPFAAGDASIDAAAVGLGVEAECDAVFRVTRLRRGSSREARDIPEALRSATASAP